MTKLERVLSQIGRVETFTGAGNRLGGEEWQTPPPEAFNIPQAAEETFPNPIQVDPTKPRTKIQFRFHDGSKHVQGKPVKN